MLSNMSNIAMSKNCKRMRLSSYDRKGGNDDRVYIEPGDTYTFADISGAGCISHIWITMANQGFGKEQYNFRKAVLRFYWDGEQNPSVQAPVGDFFGMGHGICKNYVSAPLQMSPEDGQALNCWFPMPFAQGARLTVTNECESQLILYFYVDYEQYDSLPEDALRFHALWNRQLTIGRPESEFATHRSWCFDGDNTDGSNNYLLFEATGRGHYVGCNVNIHNLHPNGQWDWPGEGDDMIFIDGEPWPPRLHGTGTEDYVNMAWCPQQEYCAPYHGLILGGKDNWKGKITYYRYHIQDAITFEKSIKVTIEHGHNNNRSDDWATTAYWYQTEPHAAFAPILPVAKRLPIDEEKLIWDELD